METYFEIVSSWQCLLYIVFVIIWTHGGIIGKSLHTSFYLKAVGTHYMLCIGFMKGHNANSRLLGKELDNYMSVKIPIKVENYNKHLYYSKYIPYQIWAGDQ